MFRSTTFNHIASAGTVSGVIVGVLSLTACEAFAQPGDASILDHEQRARTLYARGRWPESAHAWGELTKANPDQATYWQNYAYSLYASRQYDEAVAAWKITLALGYQPSRTLYNLACAESLGGDHSAALHRLARSNTLRLWLPAPRATFPTSRIGPKGMPSTSMNPS